MNVNEKMIIYQKKYTPSMFSLCHIPDMKEKIPIWASTTRKWMRDKEITQGQLATRLSITEGALSHWLTGRREPKVDKIQEIADIIGVSLSALTGETTPLTSIKERDMIERYNTLSHGDRLIIDALLLSLSRK
jgi:transcriptional regulator with XRE-family HTH domain